MKNIQRPFLQKLESFARSLTNLNKQVAQADISAVIKKLQNEVNLSVTVNDKGESGAEIDISDIDFEKLKQVFAKSEHKNQVVFDLQKAVEARLNKMLQQNPLRLQFYTEHQRIIAEYNNGKDVHAVEKAFSDLKNFIPKMSEEERRAAAEGLDQETLAIFDLLKKDNLTTEEWEQVKKVAKETLKKLKEEVF